MAYGRSGTPGTARMRCARPVEVDGDRHRRLRGARCRTAAPGRSRRLPGRARPPRPPRRPAPADALVLVALRQQRRRLALLQHREVQRRSLPGGRTTSCRATATAGRSRWRRRTRGTCRWRPRPARRRRPGRRSPGASRPSRRWRRRWRGRASAAGSSRRPTSSRGSTPGSACGCGTIHGSLADDLRLAAGRRPAPTPSGRCPCTPASSSRATTTACSSASGCPAESTRGGVRPSCVSMTSWYSPDLSLK